MPELIQLNAYPVNVVLKQLLVDKTTKKNIIFATDAYSSVNPNITPKSHITLPLLLGFDSCVIQPRVQKTRSEQSERTRKNAEVFTPSWICNKMNNYCDVEWFGRSDVFNVEHDKTWTPVRTPIQFPKDKTWQMYVDSRRLEITCGEAPYIVSRYDVATGELIELPRRIGMLDRKLRVVNENAKTEDEWLKWVCRAYQSVYGYEFQGDNLLIARINLLMTFVDYMQERWERSPTNDELKKLTNVICWNFWQMDGLTCSIPYGKPKEDCQQCSLFDFVSEPEKKAAEESEEPVDCRIYDWRKECSLPFRSLKEGKE